jgi:ACR3 family arsenite efflux pump ArsB
VSRAALERHQVWLYLATIAGGFALGRTQPGLAPALEWLLWPSLGLLLTTTFTQVPLHRVGEALRAPRFLLAALLGNFLLVPLLVAGLLPLAPADPAIRLGLLLVLLVPCTDWAITFTQLARGNAAAMIAAAPVLLLVQMLLLPVYLWALLGEEAALALVAGRVLAALALLILLPLGIAAGLERWAARDAARAGRLARLGALPVPLLAWVLFLVAAGQADGLEAAPGLLAGVAPLLMIGLFAAIPLAWGLARALRFPTADARALAFSLSTRNSFVVLPLALALPAGAEAAARVIVLQSLIELLAMILFVRLVPRLFR